MILEQISKESKIPLQQLRIISHTAEHRYRTYKIAKRTGGTRTISHPTPELKFLQRWLVRKVLSVLPVHHSVLSYRQGTSIRDVAEQHSSSNYLLRVDLANFFPSLTADDVQLLLAENASRFSLKLTQEDFSVITKIVCRHGQLTIGAPSSPALSNALLYRLDERIFRACTSDHVIYTRYADDLFFSTDEPNRLSETLQFVKVALSEERHPQLVINEKKTVFTSRKRRRVVAGLVLTSDRQISVGREKKRYIRSMVNSYLRGSLSADQISYLRGYLSYAQSVEPDILNRLRRKFGKLAIDSLLVQQLTTRKPSR
ncbi:MAG: retron St85 family RNA-directed DNA polymerase [Alphaproteobacteria bacterium]